MDFCNGFLEGFTNTSASHVSGVVSKEKDRVMVLAERTTNLY